MKAWLPDYYDRAVAGAGLAGVDLGAFPDDPLTSPDLTRVEFVVPPYRPSTVLEALPRMASLRVVQTDSAGVEWLEHAVPDGAALCNARGVHDIAVAEWVLAAVLAMAKDLPQAWHHQQRRCWEGWEVGELADTTVLILGYGSIGHAVAERLRPFGARLVPVARTAREGVFGTDDLPSLLPSARIVVVLTPLTAETHQLVDRQFLARMPDGALLVNAARGRVVDTDALLDELERGRIRAALDVTDPEPLPAGHRLWEAPATLITPHLAGVSPKMLERASALIAEQLRRCAEGRPLLNVVR